MALAAWEELPKMITSISSSMFMYFVSYRAAYGRKAIKLGIPSCVHLGHRFLLSSGAIVNNPKQAGGITPLHIASTAGFCSCIQAIGSHDGVDIDARTETDV